MSEACKRNCRPPRPHPAAVVVQLFAILVRERFPFDPDTRCVDIEGTFEDEEAPVYSPRFQAGESTRVDQMAEMREEFLDTLTLRWRGREPIVIRRSDPHIVHQQREPEHNTAHAHRAAKLEVSGIVDLRIFAFLPAIDDCFLLGFRRNVFLQCTIREPIFGMATCCLLFFGACTALPCTSRCKGIGIDAGGVLRVRILEEGGDTGLPDTLERAGSLNVARMTCFAAKVRLNVDVFVLEVLRYLPGRFARLHASGWHFERV